MKIRKADLRRNKLAARQIIHFFITLPLITSCAACAGDFLLSRAALAQTKASDQRADAAETLSFEHLSNKSGILGLSYLIGNDGFPSVADIYTGSPADKAGIKAGDEIMAVDGQNARYIGYLHLQQMLTGESGKEVKLKIKSHNGEHTHVLTRAAVESFKDPDLRKYEIAKWRGPASAGAGAATGKAAETATGTATGTEANHDGQAEHGSLLEHVIDLPFVMLSREHNRPTLFEFTDKESDPGVQSLLQKHSDGAYILAQCKIVRITKSDPDYSALRNYLGLKGDYALVPVYQPWLVTVRESDILAAPPSQAQLNNIATSLVHNSIKVQVSHTVHDKKDGPRAVTGLFLNKRPGLAHRTVFKRINETLSSSDGIVGLGFAAGKDGYATITQVFAKGPGEKAGMKDGDQVLSIDGKDTRFLGLEHIQASLAGPVGQSVSLQLHWQNPGDKEGHTKIVSLKFEPVNNFNDSRLSKLTIAKWKQVISANADDSDEYELPCMMLSRAADKPTVFEFSDNKNNDPTVQTLIDRLKKNKRLAGLEHLQDLQIVRYTPEDRDYDALRHCFKLTSSYACLPVYFRDKHKTFKASQIVVDIPKELSDKDLVLLAEKLSLEQSTKSAHDNNNNNNNNSAH